MGELYQEMEINGNITSAKVKAFLDTGSTFNIIRYEFSDGTIVFNIGIEMYDPEGAEILLPDTDKKTIYGTVTFKSISVFGITVIDPRFTTFALMNIADDVIIGHPLMQYLGMVLNFNKDSVNIAGFKT